MWSFMWQAHQGKHAKQARRQHAPSLSPRHSGTALFILAEDACQHTYLVGRLPKLDLASQGGAMPGSGA